jgi:hypothetical protein
MVLQGSHRPLSILAMALTVACLVLTVAGCSGITPLGPNNPPKRVAVKRVTAAGPPMQALLLGTPFVLAPMGLQAATPAGGCPAGSIALSGGPGQCYRSLSTPVTINTAQVSSVVAGGAPTGLPGIPAGQSGFVIILPAADQSVLMAITTAAADAHGYLSISVAGQTWLLARVLSPFAGSLRVTFPSTSEVQQLQRLLVQHD